jgi:outer membrane protein TolC
VQNSIRQPLTSVAANANIGVTRAAWYPDFDLIGLLGGQTQGSGNLLSAANRYWAVGPLINLPIFDAGRRNSQEDLAKAEFEEADDHYRSQVLRAVREVEDSLGQLCDLKLQAKDEQEDVNAAQIAEHIATDSCQAGSVNYLNVVTAQTIALQAQRDLQLLNTRRLQASIELMTALGGAF